MAEIKVMVGVAGSGKSTYIETHVTDKDLVLSSDSIRLELFGSLIDGNSPEANKKTFEVLHERLDEAVKSGKYETIYYDATNLSRKRRMKIYQKYSKDVKVTIVIFIKPLETILKQNNLRDEDKFVPEEVIKSMYESMEVPRLTVDCDNIEVVSDFNDFKDEINLIPDLKHDSPYHAEDVATHIKMTVMGVKSLTVLPSDDYDDLQVVAEFHDLGKAITKKPSKSTNAAHDYFMSVNGSHSIFSRHEKVSAFYVLSYFHTFKELTPRNLSIVEVVYQHMNAHNGISDKMIRKYNLTDRELRMLKIFDEVDSKARILNKDVYDKYIELLNSKQLKSGKSSLSEDFIGE